MKNSTIIILLILIVAVIVGIILIANNTSECKTNSDCGANHFCNSGKCYPNGVCTPNFQCSAWSTCSNNQQTRTCNDLNSCPINQDNLPILSQSCSLGCGISGTTRCISNSEYEICLENGQWSGLLTCVGNCTNGACL